MRNARQHYDGYTFALSTLLVTPTCVRGASGRLSFFFNDAASVKTDSKKSQKGRRRKRKKCGSRPRVKGRKEKKTTTRLSPVSCASLSVFFFFTYLYFVRGATTTQCETRDASLFRSTKSRWVSEMPRQRTLPRQRSVHCVVLWHVGVHFLFVMFL